LIRQLTSTPGPDRFLILMNSLVADAIPVSPVAGERIVLPVNAESRLKRVVSEQFFLRGIAKNARADVLHSTGNTLPLGTGIPAIVTLHDLQYRHYPANFATGRRLYLQAMIPVSLRRAARVICDSEYTRDDARAAFGLDQRKLCVVYAGGLTREELSTQTDAESVRRRYGLVGPFLLSVGSSLPHKNLERMIEAFASAAGSIPHAMVIVGPGISDDSRLAAALRATNLEAGGRIRRLGFVPRKDLPSLYAASDAFVFPSLFEGFGIPAVEAMQSGCPVICSRATSLPEIVGDAGLLIDPEDTGGFASAMRSVCSDPTLRERLREKGKARSALFSWEQMAEELRRIYHDVAR
ncbi:MAG TPA: glycosyltransferase family 1 protein, partial [Bacteroidota bacterium]|nr:glycosyltransferase family 1 protein [Bacteroidota bacterium]